MATTESEVRRLLKHWVRSATTPQRVVWRARIVLLTLEGVPVSEIAARLHVSAPTVRLWERRFREGGAEALLHDAPGRGRHPAIDPSTARDRLREAGLLRPDGRPTSLRAAAAHLGVSPSALWRALHKPTPGR